MPQVFHPSANTLSRLTLFAVAVGPIGLLILNYLLLRSPFQTRVRVIRDQPVPFSHEHHVSGLGLDCRYCHTSVGSCLFSHNLPGERCHVS
ncbi:MAG: cytochrome c3 family protein, partial [Isosphaeraceae bacterium]